MGPRSAFTWLMVAGLVGCRTAPAGEEPPTAGSSATTTSTTNATSTSSATTTSNAGSTGMTLFASAMARTKGITLPAVESTLPAAADGLPMVTITKSELLVGNEHIADVPAGSLGFEAAIKRAQTRSALQVMPLDAALRTLHARDTGDTTLRLLVDATTSYRSALEAVFTASHAGFTEFRFVVASKAGERSVPANTPSKAEWGAAHTVGAPQPPSFVLSPDGVTLSVGEVTIGAGCTVGAAGPAIPASGGTLDPARIAACAARIRAMKPEWARLPAAANVTAASQLDMQTVLSIVVGIEATFPVVHFGMLSG